VHYFPLAHGCLVRSRRRVSTSMGPWSVALQVNPMAFFYFFMCVATHGCVPHFCSRHESVFSNQYFLSHFVKLHLIASVPFCFLLLRQDLSIFIFISALASLREVSVAIFCYTRYGCLFLYTRLTRIIFFVCRPTRAFIAHGTHATCVHRKMQKTSLCK